jgi:hypothetical protein
MKIAYGFIVEYVDGHLRVQLEEGSFIISNEKAVHEHALEEHAGLFIYDPADQYARLLTPEEVKTKFELAEEDPTNGTGSLYSAEYFADEMSRMHP